MFHRDKTKTNIIENPPTPKENLLDDDSDYLKLSELNDLNYTLDNEPTATQEETTNPPIDSKQLTQEESTEKSVTETLQK